MVLGLIFLIGAVTSLCMLLLYAFRINSLMSAAPVDATYRAGTPLTAEDIEFTRQNLEKKSIDYEALLPVKKDRRYIVVGGSGVQRAFILPPHATH